MTVKSDDIQVLGQKALVIIDVSNVTRDRNSAYLNRFVAVRDKCQNSEVISIADASLRHYIDDMKTYEEMLAAGTIRQAPAGSGADIYILRIAEQLSTENVKIVVLTNDFKLGRSKIFAHAIKYMFYQFDGKEHVVMVPTSEDLPRLR